jgi:hypothetical protein
MANQTLHPDPRPAGGPSDPAAGRYFAHIGPQSGPILGRHRLVAIGVFLAPDGPRQVGMALAGGCGDDEVEVWELIVHDVELPGKWVVVDREFRPVQ